MQPPAEPADYRVVERMLAQNYDVARSELAEGTIPDDVDVVVVGKMGKMNPRQQYALDQFLMRGGSVVALAGAYRVKVDQVSLKSIPEDRGLLDLLEHWGVKVGDTLVMSDSNAPFPQPVQKRLPNGPVLQTLEMIPYPFFPDLRGEKLNSEHAITTGITTMTMPWSSPVSVTSDTLEDREWSWLLRTDDDARLREGGRIEAEIGPDRLPTWPLTGEPTQALLGMAVSGKFPSYFADKPNPLFANGDEGADESGRTLKASVAAGNLVVLGSSEIVSDLLIQLAQGMQSEQHAGNTQLLQNVLDWTVEDTDLLSIRTAGAFSRTLAPLNDAEARAVEIRTWFWVLVPVVAVVLIPQIRRRGLKAIPTAEQ
jgi:ABC-2 type transport system permease protein